VSVARLVVLTAALVTLPVVGPPVLPGWDLGAATAQTPSPEPTPVPTPSASPGWSPVPTPAPDPVEGSPAPPWEEDGGEGSAQPQKGSGRDDAVGGPAGRDPRHDRKKKRKPDACAAALPRRRTNVDGEPGSSSGLIEILSRADRFGIRLRDAVRRVAGPFPVAGQASWTDDWHAPRCVPDPHLHEGIDLFAREGTPVVAVTAGRIRQKVRAPISGLGVELVDADGIQYFYAHLSEFAADLTIGHRVERGAVLGYVGDTGNARGSPPHLHFEVQPGGVPVPPKPYVDKWIAVTERRARRWMSALARSPSLDRKASRKVATDASEPPAGVEPAVAPVRSIWAVQGWWVMSTNALLGASLGGALLALVSMRLRRGIAPDLLRDLLGDQPRGRR
jgi:murein DD-endopeptidase MepM/ murein hydrolase activator NlpD